MSVATTASAAFAPHSHSVAPIDAAALRAAPILATPWHLHRPFFLAAIAVTLTLGVSWGAILLWRIGFAGSYTALSAHTVNAHGEAQIYGWVGLFIMGFASQVFPRMWRSPPIAVRMSILALGLTLAGIIVRAVGLELHGISPVAIPIAVGGAATSVFGIAIFGVQMLNAFERRRVAVEPAFLFMLAAIGWMALSSVFSLVHTWMTMAAPTREALVQTVGDYQAALRDLQIHGMALTMILGVSIKMLPGMFGLPRVSNRRAMIALVCITLAVAGEASFFIAFRMTDVMSIAMAMYACWVMLTVGVCVIVLPWMAGVHFPRDDGRSGKFVRAAFAWLLVSFGMLLLVPAYQSISGLEFSHAYFGATRHAVTVGFISMMIMGIAGRVVPSLNGHGRTDLSRLLGPFLLVNIGCLLRVTLQVATDFNAAAFSAVGVSSILELAGFAWWASDLIPYMIKRRPDAGESDLVSLTVLGSTKAATACGKTTACCSACAGQ